MTYGTIKVDTVTFTDAGVDKSVTLSGLVQNPTFSGNVTVTGTLSGVTVTGTTANFTSGNFTNISGGTHTITSGVFAAGSAASPSITFTGDLNTGIYSPGADQVAISTGGTGRLFVDANGNVNIDSNTLYVDAINNRVGVGTATPSARLQVDVASGNDGLRVANNGNTGSDFAVFDLVQNSGQKFVIYTNQENTTANANSGAFILQTGSAERLRITSAGLVGIGTSSPSALLSVAATTTSYTAQSFNIGEPSLSTGRQLYMGFHTTDGVGFIQPVHWGTEYKPLVLCPNGGRVGIGTTAPGATIDAIGDIRSLGRGTSFGFKTPDWRIYNTAGNALAFDNYTTEAFRIDAANRLLVGTSSSLSNVLEGGVQIVGTGADAYLTLTRFDTITSAPAGIILGRSKSGTKGTNTAVANGDFLGVVEFTGADGGSSYRSAAQIAAYVDGAVSGGGAADMPGRLVFSTTADGASSPTERMRIANNGEVYVGTTSNSLGTAGTVLYGTSGASITRSGGLLWAMNRLTNDGDLVAFFQDTTQEGSISVSGTTVSYNGAHLSRWSQLPSAAERTEILRGTVLSNIDEMCEWGEEENEQLNRMKVSDVEGDKNVSGVFQAWDDDDDTYTNDFYCAMTGDFIIRIAAGVTVERGDLLMSAGDGTAKPQDDDIIRSKTIAKVTSTNVTCTYEDGSYCVPCVLMAC